MAEVWSDENVAWLEDLHGQGLSMSAIARVMGQGLTRSAIIGKIHRLGLAPNRQNGQRDKPQAQAARENPVVKLRPKKPPMVVVRREDEPAPLLDAAGQRLTMRTAGPQACKFIAGDDATADAPVCGHAIYRDTPWCEHHFHRVHNATAVQAARKAAEKKSAQAERQRGLNRA